MGPGSTADREAVVTPRQLLTIVLRLSRYDNLFEAPQGASESDDVDSDGGVFRQLQVEVSARGLVTVVPTYLPLEVVWASRFKLFLANIMIYFGPGPTRSRAFKFKLRPVTVS